MDKYKEMNKNLLSEETNSDLKALCKNLLMDIDTTIEMFMNIAKGRGQKYDVRRREDSDLMDEMSNNSKVTKKNIPSEK